MNPDVHLFELLDPEPHSYYVLDPDLPKMRPLKYSTSVCTSAGQNLRTIERFVRNIVIKIEISSKSVVKSALIHSKCTLTILNTVQTTVEKCIRKSFVILVLGTRLKRSAADLFSWLLLLTVTQVSAKNSPSSFMDGKAALV